jgi:hypothetical protein
MERDNFERTLRAFVRRTPFQRFTVELINGEQIVVEHPEALVFRGGVAVYIDPNGVPSLFDHEGVNRLVGFADAHASP